MASYVSLSNSEDGEFYSTTGSNTGLHFAVASHRRPQHIHDALPVCSEEGGYALNEILALTAQWLVYLMHFGSVGNVSAMILTA